MWIIKNRVTGEYERKGQYGKRDRVVRSAWGTLGQAKCHVANNGFDEWYMDADFVEISEPGNGCVRVEPVSDYLREYYGKKRFTPEWLKKRLGLLPKMDRGAEDV